MSKIVLPPVTGNNNTSRINQNFQEIAEALNDQVLYRDSPEGEPNEMITDLDMNGKRLYNLARPYLDHEAARLQDVREQGGAPFSYFGPLPADPTTRPDGSPLIPGDSYYNTVTNTVRYYNGSLWFTPNVDGQQLQQPDGSQYVGFIQSGVGAVARTSLDKMRESVSVDDYGAKGDGTDDTDAWQRAIDAVGAQGGGRVYIPSVGRSWKISRQLSINFPNIHIDAAPGTTVNCGSLLLDGDSFIIPNENNFTISGLRFVADKRVAFIRSQPTTKDIDGITVKDCIFINGFYAVRSGTVGGAFKVKNILVSGCVSVAPVGVNASHFVSRDSEFVTYIGNKTYGGQNAAAYGVNGSHWINIVGNIEYGMGDLLAGADAAIQIENSSNAVITGNLCSHDLWVDDSSNVSYVGNVGRRGRITVSELGGSFKGILFSSNQLGQINIGGYSSTIPPGSKSSAKYVNNLIDPARYLLNGNPINSAISIAGVYSGDIELEGNQVISSPAVASVSVVRNANMRLTTLNNHFGSIPAAISGTGGKIYSRGDINPIIKSGNGYIKAFLSADISAPTLDVWTPLVYNSKPSDINSELSGAVFSVKESGFYNITGFISFSAGVVGAQMGARLYRLSGSPSELLRLTFDKAAATGIHCSPFRASTLYLNEGDIIEMQYFLSGTGSTILGISSGPSLSSLEITKQL